MTGTLKKTNYLTSSVVLDGQDSDGKFSGKYKEEESESCNTGSLFSFGSDWTT